MLLLGDFIYVDVGHSHGSDPSTYRSEYHRVYTSPSFPLVLETLPWLHAIDEHEIANDGDRSLSYLPYVVFYKYVDGISNPWVFCKHMNRLVKMFDVRLFSSATVGINPPQYFCKKEQNDLKRRWFSITANVNQGSKQTNGMGHGNLDCIMYCII